MAGLSQTTAHSSPNPPDNRTLKTHPHSGSPLCNLSLRHGGYGNSRGFPAAAAGRASFARAPAHVHHRRGDNLVGQQQNVRPVRRGVEQTGKRPPAEGVLSGTACGSACTQVARRTRMRPRVRYLRWREALRRRAPRDGGSAPPASLGNDRRTLRDTFAPPCPVGPRACRCTSGSTLP